MLGSRVAKIPNASRRGDAAAGRGATAIRQETAGTAAHLVSAAPLSPGAAVARWATWIAPGALITRTVVLGALIVTPWLTATVYAEPAIRYVAAVLWLAHVVVARVVMRRAGHPVAMGLSGAMLMVDATLAGILIGAAVDARGAALAIGVAVLAIGFQLGGWGALLGAGAGVAAGIGVTVWSPPGSPLLFAPAPTYATALGVDTSFAGAPAVAVAPPQFASALDPDTSYAGTPALTPPACTFSTDLAVDTTFVGVPAAAHCRQPLLPAFALAFAGVSLGGAVSAFGTWRGVRALRRPAQ